MTSETISDVKNDISLSQRNLLTMKSKVIIPPPGCFLSPEISCRYSWRRNQHIAICWFWSRWCKDFPQIFQEQKTSKTEKTIFRNEDIVLLKAETHRNHLPLAHTTERFADSHIGIWEWKQCSARTGST